MATIFAAFYFFFWKHSYFSNTCCYKYIVSEAIVEGFETAVVLEREENDGKKAFLMEKRNTHPQIMRAPNSIGKKVQYCNVVGINDFIVHCIKRSIDTVLQRKEAGNELDTGRK